MMKSIRATCVAAGLAAMLLSGVSPAADTASESASETSDAGIPIERIIAAVSHKTGKKYLLDPRVRAHVQLVGQDLSNITYSDLLTILQLHGFVAVEGGGYVRVLPDANAREVAEPQMSSGQTKALDVASPYKPEKCEMPSPAPHHD